MNQITVRINIRKRNKASFSKEEAESNMAQLLEVLGNFTDAGELALSGGIAMTPVGRSER